MSVEQWLETIPPLSVYLIVCTVILVESLGVPLPGEIVLVSAALLASHNADLNPVWIGVVASVGAIVGDSIGYAIGKKGGKRILACASRKFPRHFNPKHIAKAEKMFEKHGVWPVFFGRFVALLRILAGPIAGSLRMHYPRFLTANALGGVLWAGGTTAAIYYIGIVAEKWLTGFSWAGFVVAAVVGIVAMVVFKRRLNRTKLPDEKSDHAWEAERRAAGVTASQPRQSPGRATPRR